MTSSLKTHLGTRHQMIVRAPSLLCHTPMSRELQREDQETTSAQEHSGGSNEPTAFIQEVGAPAKMFPFLVYWAPSA